MNNIKNKDFYSAIVQRSQRKFQFGGNNYLDQGIAVSHGGFTKA